MNTPTDCPEGLYPFDVERAINGDAVCTRDWRSAKITEIIPNRNYPLNGMVGETPATWATNGRFTLNPDSGVCRDDLFMLAPPPESPKTDVNATTATAPAILAASLEHLKARAATYDKPDGERSIPATVAAFNAITGLSVTAEQGWLFLCILKMVRSQQGDYKPDNYEDGTVYFALAGEQAAQDRKEAA